MGIIKQSLEALVPGILHEKLDIALILPLKKTKCLIFSRWKLFKNFVHSFQNTVWAYIHRGNCYAFLIVFIILQVLSLSEQSFHTQQLQISAIKAVSQVLLTITPRDLGYSFCFPSPIFCRFKWQDWGLGDPHDSLSLPCASSYYSQLGI